MAVVLGAGTVGVRIQVFWSGSVSGHSHRVSDKVRLALLRLNSTHDMSWGRISQRIGIPAATLWDIAHGKSIPRKWRHRWSVSKDLFAMSVDELRWKLENREEL